MYAIPTSPANRTPEYEQVPAVIALRRPERFTALAGGWKRCMDLPDDFMD
jgi:hypothetical protein